MYFRILGPLEAEIDGAAIDLGTPRQRQVLALLLAQPDRVVSVGLLADQLWSGKPPKTARHTIQAYIHRLRDAFGEEAGCLETLTDGYRLSVGEEVDAFRFEQMVKVARQVPPEDLAIVGDLLRQALDLWRGPVFADIPDLPALLPERTRLETMRLAALEDRIDADLALGRHNALTEELGVAVLEHPYRERLWGQLMLALYRSGRQAEALRTYQRAKTLLGEELGIVPGPWLVELEGRILLQDASISAPEFVYELPQDNLPVPRTSFLGRHSELSHVQSLLETTRLVTITGPAGVGKTRLALESARKAAGSYPHGIYFVSLAETDEPALIPSAIAASLGVTTDRNVIDTLTEHLRHRRLLLVLDNLEHLTDGLAVVADLLASAPGLTILATSRTPVRVSGERVFALDPLPAARPDDFGVDHDINVAIALFADRAAAADPKFTVTPENIGWVTQIVNGLDDLPLAIELAATRIGSMPLPEMGQRLDRALPFLNAGPIDAHSRQRTLSNAIAWSHDLLSASHRAIFRRVAVFRRGFTLDQAEIVADGPPAENVAQGVLDLVEASLITRPIDSKEGRFSMLETIREYALNQLTEAGERDRISRRHAGFFSDLAQIAEPELTGPNQTQWLDRLVSEYPNLRAALAWTKANQPDMGLVMAGSLWRFWQFRGLLADGRQWLDDMLVASEGVNGLPRVKALIGLAGICYWRADFNEAETHYTQALRLLQESDHPLLRAEALFGQMTTLACHRGDIEAAIPYEKELHELAATSREPILSLMGIGASGAVRFYTKDWAGAESYMNQTLQMARTAGNRWLEREVLFGLSAVAYMQGQLDEAEEHLRGALAIAHEMGHQQGVSLSLYWLALAAVIRGDSERAVTLAAAAARIREDHGGGFVAGDVGLIEMQDPVELARKSLDEPGFDRAWARGWAIGLDELFATAVDTNAS